MEGKMTKFESIKAALDFAKDFAGIYSPAKAEFTKIELTPEIRKKARHELQDPVCFKFNCPKGKERIVVVDIYKGGFMCWLYGEGEKGFASDL